MAFTPIYYAYQIDWFGRYDHTWEVYRQGEDNFSIIEGDDFGDWIDRARHNGYDVLINTIESWEALDAY